MNSKHFESSTYGYLSAYRPRVLHSPLTDFTVLVFCVRITLEYCVHLVESYLYCIASNHRSNVYFQTAERSCLPMSSLDSTLSCLMQPLYSVLPCQAPTTSCQASVRLGQALLTPRQILPTSSQLLY
jgi:hypothetical protein